eukprot:scaffold1170_cov139-Skeletonema_dohrnii-CCMP3373.AAC.9
MSLSSQIFHSPPQTHIPFTFTFTPRLKLICQCTQQWCRERRPKAKAKLERKRRQRLRSIQTSLIDTVQEEFMHALVESR